MSQLEMLESAVRALTEAGCEVRHDWFGGEGGGACELRGKKILFLDLAQEAEEHLPVVLRALERWAPSAYQSLKTTVSAARRAA